MFFLPYVISEVITGIAVLPAAAARTGWSTACSTGGSRASAARTGSATPTIVMLTMFVVISWKYFGFHMILMLAGLQGIPHELEEAAAIDGADALAGLPLRHPAAARADPPGLGLPVDHRRASSCSTSSGRRPGRAGPRVGHDGDLPGRLRLPARSQMGYGSAVGVILFSDLPRLRPALSAVRAAPRHRGRHRRHRRLTMATADDRPGAAEAGVQRRAGARRSALLLRMSPSAGGSSSSRSLYAFLGGFKDNRRSSSAARPLLPDAWVSTTTPTSSTIGTSGGSCSTASRRRVTVALVVSCSATGRLRLRPLRVPRP